MPSKVVRSHAVHVKIRQRRHLECNSLWHAELKKTDEHVGDVATTSQVENEPCCGILD